MEIYIDMDCPKCLKMGKKSPMKQDGNWLTCLACGYTYELQEPRRVSLLQENQELKQYVAQLEANIKSNIFRNAQGEAVLQFIDEAEIWDMCRDSIKRKGVYLDEHLFNEHELFISVKRLIEDKQPGYLCYIEGTRLTESHF